MTLIGLGFFAGAVVTYVRQHSGRTGKVEVTDCTGGATRYGGGVRCTGTWVVGGRLVGGNGHVVVGVVENAGYSDIGDRVSVRFHGDRATKTDFGLPIILLVLGLFIAPAGIYFFWNWWTTPVSASSP